MFTLIYNNGQHNRPDTALSFIESNVGKSPLLRVDCVTPLKGTEHDFIQKVCEHLNHIDSLYEVTYIMSQNCSTRQNSDGLFVEYLVIQVNVRQLNK